MKRYIIIFLMLILQACGYTGDPGIPRSAWAKVTSPSKGAPRVFGTYNNGCLAGAVKIPANGNGFHLARSSRGKIFAHPAMRDYLDSLGWELQQAGDYMLLSDVGQPRGGPIPGAHSSHQIGLDVDIWYWRPRAPFSAINSTYLEGASAPSVVKGNKHIARELFGNREHALLQTAAQFPQVDRIFVNPAVKEELCRLHAGERWMAKVRPWWGHDSHFHVRLKCPEYDSGCVSQAPVEKDDGCGNNLNWWFNDEASSAGIEDKATTAVRKLKYIPAQCWDVLKAP